MPCYFYSAATAPKNKATSPPIPPTTALAAAAAVDAVVDAVVAAGPVVETEFLPVPPASVVAVDVPFHIEETLLIGFIIEPVELEVAVTVAVAVVVAMTLVAVVVIVAVSLALKSAHREAPMLAISSNRDAGHAVKRQAATTGEILACDGPHWQATSVGAQPAALIPDAMQGRAQLGSAPRPCALARAESARRAKRDFMIVVVKLFLSPFLAWEFFD
jgi:hypothetical protein